MMEVDMRWVRLFFLVTAFVSVALGVETAFDVSFPFYFYLGGGFIVGFFHEW